MHSHSKLRRDTTQRGCRTKLDGTNGYQWTADITLDACAFGCMGDEIENDAHSLPTHPIDAHGQVTVWRLVAPANAGGLSTMQWVTQNPGDANLKEIEEQMKEYAIKKKEYETLKGVWINYLSKSISPQILTRLRGSITEVNAAIQAKDALAYYRLIKLASRGISAVQVQKLNATYETVRWERNQDVYQFMNTLDNAYEEATGAGKVITERERTEQLLIAVSAAAKYPSLFLGCKQTLAD
jgi:hypothetical protein